VRHRFERQLGCRSSVRRRGGPVPRPPGRGHRPGAEAQDHRRDVHRRVRGAAQAREFDFLAQGTLYPDVIESVSVARGPSATIKSHHNVGGLPERMRFKLVEPLRELFKDEVRALGATLGARRGVRLAAAVPGPRLCGAHPRRGHRRTLDCCGGRRHRAEEIRRPAGTAALAVVRRAAARAERRRDGRRAHLRVHGRRPRRREPRRHDGRLGAPAARAARHHLVAHRQRGEAASTAWSTTSARSRRPRSSGSRDVGPSSSTCTCTPSTRCSTAPAASTSCSTGGPS
jgi:hypothetical protein